MEPELNNGMESGLAMKFFIKLLKLIVYLILIAIVIYAVIYKIQMTCEEIKTVTTLSFKMKKLQEGKADSSIQTLFKVLQMNNGVPNFGVISTTTSPNIEDISKNIENFIDAIDSLGEKAEESVS